MNKELFVNPPAEYRSLLFWSWNDLLEEEELRRQIKEFKRGGAGGFFIHSREGLRTEYLGGRWDACVRAAVEEAKENGLEVWLYDEDRWPSGGAAGQVCRIGQDAYRCKGLTMQVCRDTDLRQMHLPQADSSLLAAYAVRIRPEDPMSITSCRRLSADGGMAAGGSLQEGVLLEEGETLLLVRVEVSAPNGWFHGEAPADLLNPETTACFIRETHEHYKELVGEEFGGTVKGIFTDEPSLADRRASFPADRGWMPWTWSFEEIFRDKRGYDLLDYVPYLYFEGTHSKKARHDYWRSIGERFCESFSEQVGAWCETEGIVFTGHFLQEDKLGLCTRVNGSVMPHYQHEQMPGIDWLGEQAEEYITVKQCGSVAAQLGKKRVLTETYAGTGWEFTFEGQKWVGDFQYVLGVNRRSMHLAFYSLQGMRKRDYPPSFHYNNTWWEQNGIMEKYFGRLSLMLTQGEAVRDILVLHPASTAWSLLGTSPYGNPVRRLERDVPSVDAYGDAFNGLLRYLCGCHYDYDLGDESLLQSLGRVEADSLCVGMASYRAVLVPPMDTVFASTAKLLGQFAAQGGKVVFMEPKPVMVEAQIPEEPLWREDGFLYARDQEEAVSCLERVLERRVSVTLPSGEQAEDILYQLRQTEEGFLLFLVNHDRYRDVSVQVSLEAGIAGAVEEWGLLSGEKKAVACETAQGGRVVFSVSLKGADSRLYDIVTAPDMDRLLYRFPESAPVTCRQPNLLLLPACRSRFGDEEWAEEEEVWKVQRRIREKLGMRPLHINGGEQWYCWADEKCPADNTPVELEFYFEADTVPEQLFLLLEQPERFEIVYNGRRIQGTDGGFFLDRAFRKVLLTGTVEGRNVIALACRYTNQMELENCYLLGDFGVWEEHRIGSRPTSLALGDWTEQGLRHYCGSVTYRYTWTPDEPWGRILFAMGEFEAACAILKVNGKVFEIPWRAAGEADVTEAVTEGENSFEIELYGTPRNMLGPFTQYGKGKTVVNSSVFHKEEAMVLVPYGLFTACELRTTK